MRKNKNTKNKLVEKTVKYYSEKLTADQMEAIQSCLDGRLSARNLFYGMFSGVNYVDKLNFYDVRNNLMAEHQDILQMLEISARAWKMELSEVISNIKSMWSNLKNDVKAHVRDNANLTEEDRYFIYYVLKVKDLLAEVLHTQNIAKKPAKLAAIQVKNEKYLYHLICRYVRLCKPAISHSDTTRSMQLDTQMYTLDKQNNRLGIISTTKGKRLYIPFKTELNFDKGNIRVVLDKVNNRLVIHKCIKVKSKKPIVSKNEVGLDKGFAIAISSSSKKEYGEGLGILINTLCDYVNKKNKGRNQYHAELRNIEKELLENKNLTKLKRRQLKLKAKNIQKNNLSNKKYLKKRNT